MSSGANATQPRSWWQHATRRPAWLILALTLLLVVIVRVRLLQMPLERDEGEYAYAGQLILQGVPPYQAAYNMKLPGTYAAYALIMALFGQSPAGIHFGTLLVNLGCIVLVFLLGRQLLDEAAGAAAALSFALLSLSPSVYGLAGHATHFVILPALGGTLLLVKCGLRIADCGIAPNPERAGGVAPSLLRRFYSALRTPHSALFFSGLLFGVAFLMKQHGIFFGLFGCLYLAWIYLAQRRAPPLHTRQGSALRTPHSALRTPPPRLSHFAAARRREQESTDYTDAADAEEKSSTSVKSVPSVATSLNAGKQTEAPDCTDVTGQPGSPLRIGQSAIRSPKAFALFLSGLAVPYLLTCVILWAAGVFPQFWFWTISYAREYASGNSLVNGPELLKTALGAAVGPNLVFWLLPWAGALVMWWEERLEPLRIANCRLPMAEPKPASSSALRTPRSASRNPSGPQSAIGNRRSAIVAPRFFLAAFFFCSFASASVGLYFRGHYFILLLPALSLLTGVAVSRALYLLRHDRTIELFLAGPILIALVLGSGAALVGDGAVWFAPTANAAHRKVYYSTVFIEAAKLAQYIKDHSAKDARVAVLGSEPEIYFLSHRRSATGYIYTYALMENQPYALRMQKEMIHEIERERPEYVVYVADDFSWLRTAQSPRRLDDWWRDYWPAHFELVTTAKIEEGMEETPDLRTGLPAESAAATTAPVSFDALLPGSGANPPTLVKRLLLLKRKS